MLVIIQAGSDALKRCLSTLAVCTVQKVLSSTTAARGPPSPLGNVKGCSAQIKLLQRILFKRIILYTKLEDFIEINLLKLH